MGTLTDVNPTPLSNAGWKLTFFDGFNLGYLDRAAWPVVASGGSSNGAYTFQPSNVVVWDGEAAINNVSTPAGWTSGAFQQGWNSQQYGRFEVRAKFDPGQGTSGAVLLWPATDKAGVEVDLVESRFADRSVNSISVHGDGGVTNTDFTFDATQWHTYTVDWLPGQLTFYLDGQQILSTTSRVPAEPMALGLLGYVNSQTDLWQGGPPNASSPGFNSMHIDWARIYTPDSLYPGALPAALYGTPEALRPSTEPWTGTWVAGNSGEFARSAVRSHDSATFATTWNAAQWNEPTMREVMSAPAAWDLGNATRLHYANFAVAELDLSAAGPRDLAVMVTAAQHGTIKTGEGSDSITWVEHSSPAAGTNNLMTILTGGGNDTVALASVAQSRLDLPFGWGTDWNPDYAGQASAARVDLGAGDDTVALFAGSAVVNGGAGADTAQFTGPAARYAVSALADGSTRVADTSGALGLTVLWGVERLRFADADLAAPGQAALGSVLDLNPLG